MQKLVVLISQNFRKIKYLHTIKFYTISTPGHFLPILVFRIVCHRKRGERSIRITK